MARSTARGLLVALAVTVALVGACRDGTVRVAFRPERGDRYAYRTEVRAESVTSFGTEPPRRTVADGVLEAHHAVLDTGPDGTTVRVRLRHVGGETATFVVRLDRAAQLSEVERVQDLPAEVLGDLGLSEIFPAAAGAPPDRPLSPGQRWEIDEPVRLGGRQPWRLRGRGRLVELGVVDGRHVATVESIYRLPVRRTSGTAQARVLLEGSQATRARSTYALRDGSVVSATATTRARYRLTLRPPEGTGGTAVSGTLVVETRTTTRRVA